MRPKTTKETLNPKQRKFIQLLLDTSDRRSIGEKGVTAGYSDNYAYKLHKLPCIVAAIDEELEHEEMQLRVHRMRVKKVLAERAEQERLVIDPQSGRMIGVDCSDANKAAELFLKAEGEIGTGGNTIITTVRTGAEELPDAMARVADNRRRILATEE